MAEPTEQTPSGWHIAGSVRTAYVAGVDPNVRMSGSPTGYLKSTKRKVDGFGTLMQDIAPDQYAGGRIKVSCYLKTVDVSAWAGLWVRVDRGRDVSPIAFDNMEDRAIRGTTDWTECVVVLDVGERASNIAFGVLLTGTGTVWIDRMRFEKVDDSVAVTSPPAYRTEPRNLDFAELPNPPEPDQATVTSAQDRRPVSEILRAVVGKRPPGGQAEWVDVRARDLHCSFCHKAADAVKKLIAGHHVSICDECVDLCTQILAESS